MSLYYKTLQNMFADRRDLLRQNKKYEADVLKGKINKLRKRIKVINRENKQKKVV